MENRADDVKHLRAELAELVKRRTEIGENLRNLERQIFAFEGSYLEDTISYGNVVRGWERYMNPNRVLSKSETKLQGKRKFKESDRLFSRSSVTGLCSVTGESINGTADELGSSAVENNVPSSPEHQERPTLTQKSHNDHGKFIRPSSVALKPTDRAAPRPSTSSAHKSTSATQRVKKTSSSPSSSSVSASKKSRTK